MKRRASDRAAYRTADPQTGPDGSSGGLRPGPVHSRTSQTVEPGQRLRPERRVGTAPPAGSALGRRSCITPRSVRRITVRAEAAGLENPSSGLEPLAQGRRGRSLRLLEGSVLDLFFSSSMT